MQTSQIIELADGDSFTLDVAPTTKQIGGVTVQMLAYNGAVPGPTLRVRQGSTITVRVVNRGDLETTVHWHGLRLDNRFDGTRETQAPIPVGGSFTYELQFPDAGAYWYHPHIREDLGQELGLYGNIIVVPADADYWPPVNREVALTLDDILIADGRIAPFGDVPDHVAMGRFGNVMLIAGESDLTLAAKRGEVVRYYLTNTANTRVFNVRIPGARMKRVGGDSGRYEREELVDEVLLAPSERAIVDVLFAEAGEVTLEHQTPNNTYVLAQILVSDEPASPSRAAEFFAGRTNAELASERARVARYLHAAPDRTLAFVAEMDLGARAGAGATYVCPMHPEVISHEAGKCPLCRMKLVPASLVKQQGHHPGSHAHHGHDRHAAVRPIEWEDDMVEVNRITTPENTRWKLIDRATGAENRAIDWRFRVGDVVKIRLVNDEDGSDHPMPHPFHVHGAGRFLILSRDGVVEPNLVWKDTVLVRTGETVDILLEVTHPGVWMAHCHIAEHHEAGMMFSFVVDDVAA